MQLFYRRDIANSEKQNRTPSIPYPATSAIPENYRSDRPDHSDACGVSTTSPDLHITIPIGSVHSARAAERLLMLTGPALRPRCTIPQKLLGTMRCNDCSIQVIV